MCWFLDMVLEACIWVQKHGILGRERTKQEPLWGREIGKICPLVSLNMAMLATKYEDLFWGLPSLFSYPLFTWHSDSNQHVSGLSFPWL